MNIIECKLLSSVSQNYSVGCTNHVRLTFDYSAVGFFSQESAVHHLRFHVRRSFQHSPSDFVMLQ